MDDAIKILVVLMLAGIVGSLGIALYHLSSGRGDSTKLMKALTVRISLSIVLFILLFVAWRAGLITPHGVR